MDDVTFAARRAGSAAPKPEVPDLETRFKSLVQSPLRAGILRFLSARPDETFESETIMQTFGRMRLDVDNCLNELVEFGVVKESRDPPTSPRSNPRTTHREAARHLPRRPRQLGIEEASPSVQRFREMIGRDEKMLAIFGGSARPPSRTSRSDPGPTGAGKEW